MAHTRKVNESFKSLTNIRLPSNSRLHMFNIMEEVGAEKFLNIFRTYDVDDNVLENEDYFEIHLAEAEDWWENLSYQYYGTPKLWWIIPLMNEIVNPFEEIEEGDRIKILKKKYVYILMKDIQSISDL